MIALMDMRLADHFVLPLQCPETLTAICAVANLNIFRRTINCPYKADFWPTTPHLVVLDSFMKLQFDSNMCVLL